MVSHAMEYYTHERNIVTCMGFQMNITETYLNNMNIILLHVNICFATETITGKLKLPLNFYSEL